MYLIDIIVSAEIDEYPSLRFQDIRKKKKVSDGHTDGQHENSKPHHKQSLRGGGGGLNTCLMVPGDAVKFMIA